MLSGMSGGSGRRLGFYLLVAPVALWLGLLVVLPLGQMMIIALSERVGGGVTRWSLNSFGAFLGEPLYWNALIRTAFFAVTVTIGPSTASR